MRGMNTKPFLCRLLLSRRFH